MDEGTKRDGTTAGCPERACGPCINRSDCAREEAAVAEALIAAPPGARCEGCEPMRRMGVHLQHCNFGENEGSCKYGDDDCPALTPDWSWLGQHIEEAAGRCGPCRERQANALLRELALRHEAEERMQDAVNRSLNILSERDAVMAERDAALVERDARIADEALRAQRVDVEALRHKVSEMKKMMAAVDARASERYALDRRLMAEDCEQRITETLAASQVSVNQVLSTAKEEIAAVRAEVQPALAELTRVRAGEQSRREALNAALEMIWAFDRKDRGAAGSHFDLLMHLRNVLSAARVHAQ